MNGFIKKAVLLGTAAAGSVGCYGYRDLVDPCYPQRYEYASSEEVKRAFAPQVANGHVLDQTVWNYHFEKGTDRLNASGIDNLARLARTRPHPDPIIFLQTACDVAYDQANPNTMAVTRTDLDLKRITAIQNYLNAQCVGRSVAFQVLVHDPAEVGEAGVPVSNVIKQMYSSYVGKLPASASSSTTGGSGASTSGGGTGGTGGAVPGATGGAPPGGM